MKYHRNKQMKWDTTIYDEDEYYTEFERLAETYPSADIDGDQEPDHYPYPFYLVISFKDEADECEFIIRESQ